MLRRAWIAFSVLWFCGVVALCHWTEMDDESVRYAVAFALTPMAIGMVMGRVIRFVAGR